MSRFKLGLRLIWWICVLAPVDLLAARGRKPSPPNRILVVKLDAIGDFILWAEAAQAIRELYPRSRCHVTLLANRLCGVLARHLGCFDEVWELDRKAFVTRPLYRYALLRRVSQAGFSKVVHPTFARDFLWGDAVVRAAGAAERVGVSGCSYLMTALGSRISDRWYTRLIPTGGAAGTALRKNARFMQALGVGAFAPRVPRLDADAPAGTPAHPYYVIAPGAGHKFRQWPVEKFAALARRIHEASGWKGVICGAAAERPQAATIISLAGAPLHDFTGVTTIPQLLGLIKNSRLVVANETAAIHAAAAVGTPSVCILGGGHYGKFLPYDVPPRPTTEHPRCVSHPMPCFNCNWVCRFRKRPTAAVPCIANVPVDAVWKEVEAIIRRSEARAGSRQEVL